MEIRSICVCNHIGGGFWGSAVHEQHEVKTLPMLSIVQSIRGSYRIGLGDSPSMEIFETGEMGVFVAPGQVTQHITHLAGEDGLMDAQWIFFNVEINRLYKLDDLYTFPTILPASYNREIFGLLTTVRTEESFLKRLPALHRLVEILLENAALKPRVPEEIARLKSYVENHYMNAITAEDLMRVLHCSRSAMYRHFRDGFGESPSHYINRVRIHHAQLLLTDTSSSIGEIAAAVGIPDVFYFARLFRSIAGVSAREYRERSSTGVSK